MRGAATVHFGATGDPLSDDACGNDLSASGSECDPRRAAGRQSVSLARQARRPSRALNGVIRRMGACTIRIGATVQVPRRPRARPVADLLWAEGHPVARSHVRLWWQAVHFSAVPTQEGRGRRGSVGIHEEHYATRSHRSNVLMELTYRQRGGLACRSPTAWMSSLWVDLLHPSVGAGAVAAGLACPASRTGKLKSRAETPRSVGARVYSFWVGDVPQVYHENFGGQEQSIAYLAVAPPGPVPSPFPSTSPQTQASTPCSFIPDTPTAPYRQSSTQQGLSLREGQGCDLSNTSPRPPGRRQGVTRLGPVKELRIEALSGTSESILVKRETGLQVALQWQGHDGWTHKTSKDVEGPSLNRS
ncbi:hypothetical protein BS47DRAFT_1389000 [Hydnum rufescens UP504]|uniref:Uncharacterized protein n=1 Tax=Hydnum rufescens UP504 TaxID=1448309 RepID=A0A9P6B5Z1_9AGAM|nr:hypothetical protein BS47DRAFT_1389000 [Hydnum rufescens UP504]